MALNIVSVLSMHCSTLKTVTEHYVKRGSTVNLCALDIAKAFDRVDHFALLQLLMDRHLPENFIGLLYTNAS